MDSKRFHRGVKAFLSAEEVQKWDVRSIFPNRSDLEVAEDLADFFNGISSEYEPLDLAGIPTIYDEPLPQLTVGEVGERLRRSKKTASLVEGDIFPCLFGQFSDKFAPVVADIFNTTVRDSEWATLWKTEYVTVIPKVPSPSEVSECRNISCTNFLSKVLESFVLDWAKKQVVPKRNQFGGEKGCATAHYLAEVWNEVALGLEDYRAAVTLTAIDYSKAFNRLEHRACLESFAKKVLQTRYSVCWLLS